MRDLTERYSLISSLTKKEERFQDITNSTGDWIWEVNKDGVFVFTNSCAEKIIGYTPDEIIGKNFVNFLVPNHHAPAMAFLRKQKNKKESFAYELRSFHKSGKVVVLDIKAVSILNDSGAVIGYRGVTRDITEKIEMHKKLLKSERLAVVGELATMIAHDLRNPLQSISTAMYCLEKVIPEENSEKTKKLVANVKNSLNYSDKIVRELLDYSAKIKLDLAKTAPSDLIKKALSTITVPSEIKLLNNSKNKPVVYVDVNRIRRVCVNIITNVFDAMPKGGTLTISSKTEKNNLEIRFSDTGEGMTKQQIKKLMIPFVTTKAKGMGLGLAISKRIIEAHHGKIVVNSIVGQGTTFTVVLPLQKHAKSVALVQNKPQPMEQISRN